MSFLHNRNTCAHLFITFLIISSSLSSSLFAQSAGFWQDVNSEVVKVYGPRYSTPVKFRAVQLDTKAMSDFIKEAPLEFTDLARSTSLIISLPMADGSFSEFEIFESPVMAAGLSAQYPYIKTYAGSGVTDPRAHLRLDLTNLGFHAMILSPRGDVFIDPINNKNDGYYLVYDKKDLPRKYAFDCLLKDKDEELYRKGTELSAVEYRSSGDQLRIYRLALACTGEYAATKGGTVSGALAGMVTSVNRISGIYESEFAIRMQLIDNDTQLIYLSASSDPYTNNNGFVMLDENQNNIEDVIGSANYDIGHVFSTGGGGIAGLGVVCNNGQKSWGVTGLPNPVGDAFDVDYVAHEMGHQFGANHTFNSTSGACGGGNRWASTAYEPGSGSTIMSYAGICSPNDLQPHSDPFFHSASYDEIMNYTTLYDGATCPVMVETGNTVPVADAGSSYSIPFKTYFKLTGSGSDADGDSLSYMWEEMDKGSACNMNAPIGNAPSFRSFKPDSVPYRYFPKLPSIVTGTISNGETLPTYARSLKFRFIVRDNQVDGGGLTYDDNMITLTVINTTTPFELTYPNALEIWGIGTPYIVSWDVSSTDLAPINCSNVNLLLSLDGGYTYPVTLLTNTANDGSEEIFLPLDSSLITSKARVMVQSVGNVFFDISDQNFTIDASTSVLTAAQDHLNLNVFPNPTNGLVNVSLEGLSAKPLSLTISDMIGRTVQEQFFYGLSGSTDLNLDISNTPNGVYFIEVKTESNILIQKIVKQ